MHIDKAKTCEADYNENELDYIREWARKRKNNYDSNYYQENKDTHYLKEQKKSNNKLYKESRKIFLVESKKKSKQILLEVCKGCKKNMGKKSILMHLSQKESCKNDYTEEEMYFLI